jgi:hypothetical protein
MLDALWWVIATVFGVVWTIVAWIAGTLLWLSFWVLLPFAIGGFVALRVAESVLGRERVRAWVKSHTLRYGAATWQRAHRGLFTLGALPLRVLGWLMVYTLWHSVVSLLWTPKWRPWPRAWDKRWRKRAVTVTRR